MKLDRLTILLASICILIVVIIGYNFRSIMGWDVFISGREFGMCYTELILKDNNFYIEERTCFFDETTSGDYEIKNDTIFFEGYSNDNHTYIFGLVEKGKYGREVLNLYNERGRIETMLYIDKNELFD